MPAELSVRQSLGWSVHQLRGASDRQADRTSCDYIAYGPIFPTASKANPDPTVGLAGLKAARALTAKPLVAIGGITRKNCRSVIDAGADSLAVISDLLPGVAPSDRMERLHAKSLRNSSRYWSRCRFLLGNHCIRYYRATQILLAKSTSIPTV